jgi:hypothetical protein
MPRLNANALSLQQHTLLFHARSVIATTYATVSCTHILCTYCSDNNSPLRVVGGGEDNWQNEEDPRGDQLGADDLLIHELVRRKQFSLFHSSQFNCLDTKLFRCLSTKDCMRACSFVLVLLVAVVPCGCSSV